MANCLNCGTWNPEDKVVCWRCQTELPRPQPTKKRGPQRLAGLPSYVWIALVLFIAVLVFGQCWAAQIARLGG